MKAVLLTAALLTPHVLSAASTDAPNTVVVSEPPAVRVNSSMESRSTYIRTNDADRAAPRPHTGGAP